MTFKKFLILFVFTNFILLNTARSAPNSFADLAERLMPSVVNISTTQTVTTNSNSFPFQFPPGSPFEDMFKDFGTPQERQAYALGSGFIIDEKGIVITNNHVIQNAEDILVRVNGDEEYKAKIIGKDPLSDIAVLQIEADMRRRRKQEAYRKQEQIDNLINFAIGAVIFVLSGGILLIAFYFLGKWQGRW